MTKDETKCGIIKIDTNTFYKGGVDSEGVAQGFGVITFADGSTFSGVWKNGALQSGASKDINVQLDESYLQKMQKGKELPDLEDGDIHRII